jgi:hypothetical protein
VHQRARLADEVGVEPFHDQVVGLLWLGQCDRARQLRRAIDCVQHLPIINGPQLLQGLYATIATA